MGKLDYTTHTAAHTGSRRRWQISMISILPFASPLSVYLSRIYPAYLSVRVLAALRQHHAAQNVPDAAVHQTLRMARLLLAYWALTACWSTLLDTALPLQRAARHVPHEVVITLLMWMLSPVTRGAERFTQSTLHAVMIAHVPKMMVVAWGLTGMLLRGSWVAHMEHRALQALRTALVWLRPLPRTTGERLRAEEAGGRAPMEPALASGMQDALVALRRVVSAALVASENVIVAQHDDGVGDGLVGRVDSVAHPASGANEPSQGRPAPASPRHCQGSSHTRRAGSLPKP